ncbi:MAG: beta-galactosidase trimerization domain-containing protein [Candidatus Omnitrophica bacterium]|nr:beta-galactosidase trimerization domain-containing protein [Candidatus Omnitrophota bacterium]
MMGLFIRLFFLSLSLLAVCFSETIFLDANTFEVSGNGWKPNQSGYIARQATWQKVLHGADGAFDSIAFKDFEIKKDGTYKIWVRYLQSYYHRGPFNVSVFSGEQKIASKDFDVRRKSEYVDLDYVWDDLETNLAAGKYKIVLSKVDKNTPYYFFTRAIDCLLITDQLKKEPDHTPYGPQIYLRVSISSGHEKPFYIHIFANYYRAPWYAHFSLTKAGLEQNVQPLVDRKNFFTDNQTTDWLNVTRLMYFDSGVNLTLSARYSYAEIAPKLNAKFEFAYQPSEAAIVKTIQRDASGSMRIIIPPDFRQNPDKFTTDLELAEKYGSIADSMKWPVIGKKPVIFPFFVSANLPTVPEQISPVVAPVDRKTFDREWKTLDYFGFSNRDKIILPTNTWNAGLRKNYACYCGVDIQQVNETAKIEADRFKKQNKKVQDIAYCMLMDEPHGLSVDHLLGCETCKSCFRNFLQELKMTPQQFGAEKWEEVKPVDSTQKDTQPELFYYTQKFRTYALRKLICLQKEALHQAYGSTFPVNVNFSDGAVYIANFGCIGVDYFDLLDTDDNNSIWSEDWANGSSTRQCTAYNSELMRSAAMKNNKVLGHYLIGYAGRSSWTMKTYTASHVARDNKILNAYWYGPVWSAHEAGPPWNNHSIQARTDMWYSLAEIVREIGAAEDILYTAKKRRSQVAIIYSSSADIWEMGNNYIYGFERMHTWLALTHNQIPVDFLSEKMIEEGWLKNYKVAYFSGTAITRKAAEQIRSWVSNGGRLVLTAGAGMKDEFNRPNTILKEVLPAIRSEPKETTKFLNSGRYLDSLSVTDTVIIRDNGSVVDVVSVKQHLKPKPNAELVASFSDFSPAIVKGKYQKGTIYCIGFLPAIAYMRLALIARNQVMKNIPDLNALREPDPSEVVSDQLLIKRAFEPWVYQKHYRDLICKPVFEAGLELPIKCSIPIVDAVVMDSDRASLVVLSNYTFQPIEKIQIEVLPLKKVQKIESVHQGVLKFSKKGERVAFELPLRETDFVKIYYTQN